MATTFPTLLGLPREIRLSIYDSLFEPMLATPIHRDTYVLPSEWPVVTLEDYASLVRVCTPISREVLDYFTKRYLPHLTFYFTSEVDLYEFAQRVQLNPQIFNHPRFSLRTRVLELYSHSNGLSEAAVELKYFTHDVMLRLAGLDRSYLRDINGFLPKSP